MAPSIQQTGPIRHYGMDWLRIGAFALLILYHVGMYFVPWSWHVQTPEPMDWVRIPMLASNAWRLSLLFVVSGFASAALFAKLDGRSAFLRSRNARLLIPLIFGAIIIVPAQPWVEMMFKHGYTGSFWQFWTQDYFRFGTLNGIILPTWQHLWFIVYLWVYTLALGLLLLIPANWRRGFARICDRALAGPLLLVVPLSLIALHNFVLFRGVGDTHALVDDWGAHSIFFPVFLFGWLLFSSDHVWAGVRRYWKLAGVLALAAFAIVAVIIAGLPSGAQASENTRILFTAARVVQGWCTIIALIGLADRFLNHDLPIRATLTEAVFPFYIIHQTIIVLVGWWLLPTGIGQGLAFLIMVAATIVGCAIFYWGGRMIPPLRPLIGLTYKNKLKASSPRPANNSHSYA